MATKQGLSTAKGYQNKIPFATNADYATSAGSAIKATNATYATYASNDTSKGNIEDRLTSLEKKETLIWEYSTPYTAPPILEEGWYRFELYKYEYEDGSGNDYLLNAPLKVYISNSGNYNNLEGSIPLVWGLHYTLIKPTSYNTNNIHYNAVLYGYLDEDYCIFYINKIYKIKEQELNNE